MVRSIWIVLRALFSNESDRIHLVRTNSFEIYRFNNAASYLMRWIPLQLQTIFYLNGTDKHSPHGHRYGPHYGRMFSRRRYRSTRLLEIGIGGYRNGVGGNSITAWRWYFPFLNIVACDIEDRRTLASSGVNIYQADQSNPEDLARLLSLEKDFDIIIDDGSHLNDHQINTFCLLFPSLREGGIYVVEDVQTSYWPNMGGTPIGREGTSCMRFFLELTHYLNGCEFPEDSVIDPDLKKLADAISTISFNHNLIFIEKSTATKLSNVMHAAVRDVESLTDTQKSRFRSSAPTLPS